MCATTAATCSYRVLESMKAHQSLILEEKLKVLGHLMDARVRSTWLVDRCMTAFLGLGRQCHSPLCSGGQLLGKLQRPTSDLTQDGDHRCAYLKSGHAMLGPSILAFAAGGASGSVACKHVICSALHVVSVLQGDLFECPCLPRGSQ